MLCILDTFTILCSLHTVSLSINVLLEYHFSLSALAHDMF